MVMVDVSKRKNVKPISPSRSSPYEYIPLRYWIIWSIMGLFVGWHIFWFIEYILDEMTLWLMSKFWGK